MGVVTVTISVMVKIPLTGRNGSGKYTIIDDEDYPKVANTKWHYGCKYYAVHHKMINRKHFYIYLHKVVLGVENKTEVDHINGDKLDNRRSNLRICTHQQNMHNKGMQKNNKSGFKGVSWDSTRKRWKATISHHDRTINLGRFQDKMDAVRTYNNKAVELFGEFARTNSI